MPIQLLEQMRHEMPLWDVIAFVVLRQRQKTFPPVQRPLAFPWSGIGPSR